MSHSQVQKISPVPDVAEKILDKRLKDGKVEYRVKWQGYSIADSTWNVIRKLKKFPQLIKDYEQKISNCKVVNKNQSPDGTTSSSEERIKELKQKIVSKKRSSSSSQQDHYKASSESSLIGKQMQRKKKGRPLKRSPPQRRPTTTVSSSSESQVKKGKPNKKVSSSDDEEPIKTKAKLKKVSVTPSSPTTSLERSRSQRANTKVKKLTKDQVVPKKISQINDTVVKKGSFLSGDKPKEIVNIRKDIKNQKVEFQISWSNKRNGKTPLPTWFTEEKLKEKAPEILCDFLLQKIKWPEKI